MNTFRKKISSFILACSAVLLPHSVFASTIYIDTNHPDFFVGDTILFRVRVDSERKDINAIEGDVSLQYPAGAVSLIDINTAGSLFSLWPVKPLPSDDNTSISFAGGSPGGLVSKDAIIFTLALNLREAGQITLSPDAIEVYLNDGKGTKDTVTGKDLTINVLPGESGAPSTDELDAIISRDKTPPESFEINLGNDPSLFENRYFISFFTRDAESGIAYYEVQEGGRDFVRAGSPYVLTDQSLSGFISVKAVDRAGNERIEKFMPTVPAGALVPVEKNLLLWVGGIILIVLAIAAIVWKAVLRKK